MAKGGSIEYSINFNVNKQNLDALQKSLDEIIVKAQQTEKILPDFAGPFTEAAGAAKDLQKLLTSSWNPKIGQIDLSQVEKGLVNLYGSTKNFKDILGQIGPEGQKVFNDFTQAVLRTQMPVKQTNAMLDKLAISFKNTIRYGISSSIWNKFSNSVREAYSYVKDLDKSLNDIRIVSGQSADQMERLAIQANKTAQELGKSTLDYTKAALIYYQQGLSGDDVTQRTEVTLKMANVLGESAKDVSNYMTAIWNNFDEGSESLEHYADVITALGASTAASSEEIATGLEKFSAVAKTVGLSYEYATSALATVVAQTRQSADSVGTAFKTIFARMEDLKLGKTLEDGTTLGKYSSTLAKIGVNIKDQNNQLKNMDTILSELGNKWQTLNKDQQIAVAQGVAGVRQYTQLVALLENWDKFETNLATAGSAEGTLQKQQEIYLDSIEAHLQQLDTAWEALYKNIFDEDALKFLTDALTKIINLADTFVTGLGGGLNSIIYIAMSLGNIFSKQISENLIRMENNAERARKALAEVASAKRLLEDMEHDAGALYNLEYIGIDNYLDELELQQKLLEVKENLSEADQATLHANQDLVKTLREENAILDRIVNHRHPDVDKKQLEGETKEQTQRRLEEEYKNAGIGKREWQKQDTLNRIKVNTKKVNQNNELINLIGAAGSANLNNEDVSDLPDLSPRQLEILINASKGLGGKLKRDRKKIAKLEKEKPDFKGLDALKEKTAELQKQKDMLDSATKSASAYKDISDPSRAVEALRQNNITLEHNIKADEKKVQMLEKVNNLSDEEIKKQKQANQLQIDGIIQNEKNLVVDKERQEQMNNFVSGLFTIGSTLSSITGIFKTIFNPNISLWDKLSSIFSVIATQSIIIWRNWDKIKTVYPTIYAWVAKKAAAVHAEVVAKDKELVVDTADGVVEKGKTKEQTKQVALQATKNQLSFKDFLINLKNLAIDTLRASLAAKIVTGIGLAVAAGYALYKVISWIVGKSEEQKLKEAVAETAEEVKKTTEAYQDLKDKISDYTDAKKGLEGLKEGTVEFYEAVITANEKAQTLIDTLGLLAGQDYSIDVSSGLISINEDSLKNALQSKQQAVFRAQATNTFAKLDLTKYYQRQTVGDFASAVFEKTGVMLSDAEKILDGTVKQTAKMDMWGLQRESDITEEVGKFRAEYNKRSAEMLAQQELLAAQLIQGYASQSQLEAYQALTKTGQSLINSYIVSKSDLSDIDTDFDKYEEQAKANILKQVEAGNLKVNDQLYNTAGTIFWLNNEDFIKGLYAKEKLGWNYNQKSEEWTNESGNKTNLEDISYREAIQGWSIGQQTEESINNTLNYVKKLKNTEAIGSLNADSKDYVTEAAIAISTGQTDKYNFSSMTPEEIDALKAAYNELGGSFLSLTHLSDEYFEKLKSQTSEEARAAEDLKRYNEEIVDQATQLGISKNALKVYDTALQNASKSTIEYTKSAASAAAQAYEFNKNYNAGRKAFEDSKDAWNAYTKALKKGEDISYDVADAVGEIIDDLEKMGITLNNSQLKDPKVLSTIQKLFTGTKKEAEAAYQELEKLSLDNMWDQWRAQVLKTSTLTNEAIEDLKRSITSLNENDLIKGDNFTRFREYISNAHMTYDELIKFLDANHIKYEVDDIEPVEVKKNTIPGSKTTQRHTITGTNPYTGEKIDSTLSWEETVENLTSDFYTLGKEAKITKGAAAKTNFSPSSSSSKKSSGSNNKPDKKDPITTEIDRYHKVNTQITKVDNSLKKLQSQQEKLVGSKLIENLTKQWELLNTQINNYTEKLKIANGEQAELAEKLKKDGVLFNEDGTVRNYAEAIKAQEDYVNSIIDKYNKMSKTQQESYKKTVEQAEKDFDKFKTNIDRYDELVSDFIPQLHQSIQDSIDKQIELNVEKFNLEITVTLDLNQATRDWNAWARRAIYGFSEEDILGKSEARAKDFYTYFNNNGTGDVQISTKHVKEILEELGRMDLEEDNVYGDNRAKGIEELKERYTELMGKITDVIELQDELHQNWLDKMDEVQEKFDEQINSYEFLREILNHDLKVVQLAYGDDVYDKITKFYEQQQDNYEKQLDFQRQQKDFWYAEMKAAEEGTKEWESARDKWKEAVKEFNSILQEGLQNAIDKFKNAINLIFKNLNNSLTGGLGLDYVQTQWDLINKNADRYLDTINATYSIRELEKKYIDSINKIDSVSKQQKLRKVMEEQLAAVKEKERLTQYDIDRANKLYEIEMARIALEEARNNKSQMRLRRDSQGNYRYQYTADLDAVKKAQDDLDNLYNSLYNFDKERYNAILNDIYTTWNEYQQKMAEAALINDPELRAERQRLIQQEYNELMMQIEDDYQISKYNLQESFFNDWVKLNDMELDQFKLLTDNEKNIIMTEMVPTWENGLSQMGDAFYGEAGFAEQTKGAWQEIKDATKGYDDDLKDLEDVAGITFEAIADGEDTSIEKAKDLIKENQGIIDKYGDELHAVEDCYKSVRDLIEAHKDEMDIAKEAAEAAYKYYSEEAEAQQKAYEASEKLRTSQKAAAEANAKATASVKTTTTTSSGSGGSGSGGKTSNSGSGSSSKTTNNSKATTTTTYYKITVTDGYSKTLGSYSVKKGESFSLTKCPSVTRSGYKFKAWHIKSSGKEVSSAYSYIPTGDDTIYAVWDPTMSTAIAAAVTGGVNALLSAVSSSSKTNTSSWIKTSGSNYGLKAYATGGYTGDWNDGGRLAVLHQKELVLNQTDTKNMLNAVSIMRNLSGTLGTEMLARLGNANAPKYTNGNSGASLLEQDVHIDATFPNVRNAAEIEEALNNLVNAASQRAMINR